MSDLLSAASHELELLLPHPVEVVRVDVDDEGALHLMARSAGTTRWFSYDDRGLIERHPEQDPALPLARRLRSEDGQPWRALSYRPGRRVVVEMRRGEALSVLKGHRKRRSARAALNQGIAERALERTALRTARLLRHDGEHETLVFEHLAVREIQLDDAAEALFERLGRALQSFQRDPSAADLQPHGASEELAVLERMRAKLARVQMPLPEGWLDGRDELECALERLPAPELGLAHRDLHDRQLLLAGDAPALLDFDLLCAADVALDAGNLLAHLDWRVIQGLHGATAASVARCAAAFDAGLGRQRERGFAQRLAYYRASTWLRLALVYRLRPRWSELTPRLVDLARDSLQVLARSR